MQNGEETKPEPSEAEAREVFARRPSTMPPIGIDLCGFATTDSANSVGVEVQGLLSQLCELLNLKRLMRVIVAYNYKEMLAEIDRGTSVSPQPIFPTENRVLLVLASEFRFPNLFFAPSIRKFSALDVDRARLS